MNESIRKHFSGASATYGQHAVLQKDVARRLAASLQPWRDILPPGPVLEVGAGTGFFTRELAALLPGRKLVVTDISPEMLEECRRDFPGNGTGPAPEFRTLDAGEFRPEGETHAMVAGNFVAQWFRDPPLTLERLAASLKPGGLMLFSFPGHESFPEWRKMCLELGLPYTGNPLPDTEEMVIKLSVGGAQVDFYEDSHVMTFPDSMAFFRHLKKIGSSSLHTKKLTPRQLKLLTGHWDRSAGGPVSVTWHLVFLALRKDT